GYAAPASGRDADLATITLDDARRDLGTRFAAARALVTVTGRFDPNGALEVLKGRFGAPTPALPPTHAAPPAFGPLPARADAGTTTLKVSVVLAGWRLPPARDPDTAALEVLAQLLAGRGNARLGQTLITPENPFLQFQSSFERRSDGGVLVIAAALDDGADTAKVESQLAH